MIQRRYFSGYAAPALYIDKRISARSEYVSGADHIRAAEEHQTVSVRMRIWFVKDHNGFSVEVQSFLRRAIFIQREAFFREFRLSSGGNPVQYVFMTDDLQRIGRIFACQLRDGGVAAHVIRVHMRVDDV